MSETFDSEAGETTALPAREAASGPAKSSMSQDNAAAGAGQPIAAPQRSRWPALAPWVALGAPLVFNLLAVVYDRSQEWGFLGNLWLIFVIAGVGLATTLWLAAWLLLSTWPVWGRAAYFFVGLASLAAITSPTIPWWEDDWNLSIWLAVVVLGVWLPFYFWRRAGWRISAAASAETARQSGWLKFSIRDLLVITTGIAAILGLALSRGELDKFTVAVLVCQIAAGTLVFWFALTWRNYASAIGASALSVVVIAMAGFAFSDPGAFVEPSAFMLLGLYAGPATTSALVTIAIVRSAGYRLRA